MLDQGQQAVRVGTADITMITGGSERLRVLNNGNVGIGVTATDRKLDVLGNFRVRSAVNATNGYSQSVRLDAFMGDGPYSSYSTIQAVHEGSMANSLCLNPAGGNVGIGTTNPPHRLSVIGDFFVGGSNSNLYVGHSSDSTGITINNKNSGAFTSYCDASAADANPVVRNSLNAYFRTRDANVNLGACIQLLDLNTFSRYDTQIRGGAIAFSTVDGNTGFGGNPALERMRINPWGNVGIGISSPSHRLHVNAYGMENAFKLSRYDTPFNNDIHFEYEHYPGLAGYRSRITSAHVGDGKTNLYFYTATSAGLNNRFTIGWDGNGWIAGTLTQGSDISLKKNIETLPYGLQTIQSLNPVQYHFKVQDDSSKKHFGLIAQEVQDILPQLVGTGADGKLSLSYIELVPILINAVKEQQSTISSLSDRLARLEALLSR